MENQRSSYQCLNTRLCVYRYKVSPKQTGGQRIVQSQISFYCFTISNPPCSSLNAECKARCLNRPDYRYWILQSVSLCNQTSTRLSRIRSSEAYGVKISTFVASLYTNRRLEDSSDSSARSPWVDIVRVVWLSGGFRPTTKGRHRLQEARRIVWEPFCWGGGWGVELSLWHDDLAVWGLLR